MRKALGGLMWAAAMGMVLWIGALLVTAPMPQEHLHKTTTTEYSRPVVIPGEEQDLIAVTFAGRAATEIAKGARMYEDVENRLIVVDYSDVVVVEDTTEADILLMRVDEVVYELSEGSNWGVNTRHELPEGLTHAVLEYDILLSPGFYTRYHGKLPGLASCYWWPTGIDTGGWGGNRPQETQRCWSARINLGRMYNEPAPRVPCGPYVYHQDQESTWADNGMNQSIEPGVLTRIRQEVEILGDIMFLTQTIGDNTFAQHYRVRGMDCPRPAEITHFWEDIYSGGPEGEQWGWPQDQSITISNLKVTAGGQ